MKDNDEIVEAALKGGLIGAGLGLLLTRNSKDIGLSALASAAFFAGLKAYENAQKTNVPLVVEEDGSLFEINSKGEKKFIKSIPKSTKKYPSTFKLQ